MMKRIVLLVLVAVIAGLGGSAEAAVADFDGQAGLTVLNNYVWRGREINDALVIQPELTLSMNEFNFNMWGTWDFEHEKDATSARTRLDVSLDYTVAWEKLGLTAGVVGHIYHDRPDSDGLDTYEFYVDIMVDTLLYPSLIVYYDFERIEGIYAVASAGYAYDLNTRIDLEAKVSLGMGSPSFNRSWFPVAAGSDIDTDTSSLVDLKVRLGAPTTFSEAFLVTPYVVFSTLVGQELKDAAEAEGLETSNVSVGANASWEF